MEKNQSVNSKINAVPEQAKKAKLLRLATYASVLTAAILIIAKLTAWMLTGSISVLASLVDSLMDIIASIINLFAVRYSLQPADAEHRFGHGKAEPLAGLAQAAFITGSAIFLLLHAVERLRYPHELQGIGIGIAVMVLAISLTLGLLLIQRYVIKKTASTAIRADALHYGTDLLTNLSIIFALILASFGWFWADAVFAIAVAIYIFYSALRIGYEAFQQLMDRELPTEVHEQILSIARQHPAVCDAHGLRTRQSGQTKFIQLHLELDDNLSLIDAHAIGDQVEHDILAILPEAEVIIHQDPVSLKDRPRRNLTYE
jgi:ferrous-iron efflux pump FieF